MEAEGLLAVCIQHEMDHLEGKLFVDYLSELKRQLIRRRLEKERRQRATGSEFSRFRAGSLSLEHGSSCPEGWVSPARRSSRFRRSMRCERHSGFAPCSPNRTARPAAARPCTRVPSRPGRRMGAQRASAGRFQVAGGRGDVARLAARRFGGRRVRLDSAARRASVPQAGLHQHPRLAAAALARRRADPARGAGRRREDRRHHHAHGGRPRYRSHAGGPGNGYRRARHREDPARQARTAGRANSSAKRWTSSPSAASAKCRSPPQASLTPRKSTRLKR